MVERSAVNRRVAGSSPARGATSKWLVADCDSLHQHKPDCTEWLEKVRNYGLAFGRVCFEVLPVPVVVAYSPWDEIGGGED